MHTKAYIYIYIQSNWQPGRLTRLMLKYAIWFTLEKVIGSTWYIHSIVPRRMLKSWDNNCQWSGASSLQFTEKDAKRSSQHWFRQWPGAVWQKAITWATVYQGTCHHIASLGTKMLTMGTLSVKGQFLWQYIFADKTKIFTKVSQDLLGNP